MKNLFKKLLVAAAVLYFPAQAMAWGTNGHRITGQIAYSYLTPKARAAIKAILGNESLALAGNWADFERSNPDYKFTETWHYVNLDKGYTLPEIKAYLAQDTVTDAYTKLNFLMGELKKKTLNKDQKFFALHMLIHLIEDIHQPMHTAHSFDKGGNDVKVTWFNNPTNLHTIWDSQLIDFQQMSFTEYATEINHTTAAQRAAWQKAPIAQWLYESNVICQDIYAYSKDGDKVSPYNYNYKFISVVNQRLLQGGVRLAGVLNEIFG
ncbi:S1/P1 nuclease [Mucilaginibacter gilvus]|uniref:S1/P1 Nuclease n=1 Tax=Mucilaginibacter gilvus TaxID=2305909 RepID=A0A3S3VTZ6_9SPHI|nr:S1/P1 nuclease [Mucilaginibacter gilvus]RWY55866.1 S1/P1 Nuclease [Mucilaginibacter gilvus]